MPVQSVKSEFYKERRHEKDYDENVGFGAGDGRRSVGGDIIYVDDDAASGGGGTSWADAYNLLQDGLDDAVSGDEIWVAAGIYWPDLGVGLTVGDRYAAFQLKNGVALYGGFPTGGGTWIQRDSQAYETILSGDYRGLAEAGPTAINRGKPMPMQLMRNYADSLRVDKVTVKSGNKASSDSLTVKGAIAADNSLTSPCAQDIVITWGSQTFTVAKESVTVSGTEKYTFKNVAALEGGVVSGTIDQTKCTFKITVKSTDITVQSGTVTFGLTFEGYNQTDSYMLP